MLFLRSTLYTCLSMVTSNFTKKTGCYSTFSKSLHSRIPEKYFRLFCYQFDYVIRKCLHRYTKAYFAVNFFILYWLPFFSFFYPLPIWVLLCSPGNDSLRCIPFVVLLYVFLGIFLVLFVIELSSHISFLGSCLSINGWLRAWYVFLHYLVIHLFRPPSLYCLNYFCLGLKRIHLYPCHFDRFYFYLFLGVFSSNVSSHSFYLFFSVFHPIRQDNRHILPDYLLTQTPLVLQIINPCNFCAFLFS